MVIFPIIWLCLSVVYCEWDVDVHINPDKFEDNDKPFAEFSCTAYLHQGEWLVWYQEKPSPSWLTTFKQGSSGGNKTIELILPLDSSSRGSEIYCVKQKKIIALGLTRETISKSKNIRIDFQKNVPPTDRDKPQVTNDTVIYESGAPILEVTCWAYLETNQRLSWYQTKGIHSTTLLTYKIQDTDFGYVKVLLQKTLEPNDIGTQIFCAHDTIGVSDIVHNSQSRTIPILLNRPLIDVWGPFVNPDPEHPDTLPTHDKSSVIEYTCNGYLYQGELLTWFQVKDSNAPERIRMIQQSVQYGKLEINLQKTLEAKDNGTEIYCAKESVQLNQSIKATAQTKRIPIVYRGQNEPVEKKEVEGSLCGWLGAAVGVALMIIIALVILALRLRRKVKEQQREMDEFEAIRNRPPCPAPEEYTYEQVYAHGAGLKRPRHKQV